MTIDTDREAGALILENLALFNQAARYYEEVIDPEITQKIKDMIDEFSQKNEFRGSKKTEELHYDGLYLTPKSWIKSEEKKHKKGYSYSSYADFWLSCDNENNSYTLANICNAGQEKYTIQFCSNDDDIGITEETFDAHVKLSALTDRISNIGFEYNGQGVFSFPISIDPLKLAQAWRDNDYTEALQPVNEALEKIRIAFPLFDELIQTALKKAA